MQTSSFTVYSSSNYRPKTDSQKIRGLIRELESFKSARDAKAYIDAGIGVSGINSVYLSAGCKLDISETISFYKVTVSFNDEKLVFSYKKI